MTTERTLLTSADRALAFTTSNFTRTTNTLLLITGTNALRFAIAASERWAFQCLMSLQCDNTGGVGFGINGPSGATVEAAANGAGGGGTAFRSARITALATSTGAFAAAVTTPVGVVISGTMLNSTNAGTLDIMCRPITDTQTATIFAGAVLLGWRLA
jgi:hypothetical protein